MEKSTKILLLIQFFVLFGHLMSVASSASCREPPVNPENCCKYPKPENADAIVDDCVKTYKDQVTRERAVKTPGAIRGCCIAECIMNGTGHMDVSAAKMIELDLATVEKQGTTADWGPVIKATGEKCEAEAKKREKEFEEGFKLAPVDPADQVCHPKYVFALMCTAMEELQNCPAKYFTDTKECQDLKEFFKTCDM